MTTREELISQCRYYKGEKIAPYNGGDPNKSMLWFYEEVWVNDTMSGDGDFEDLILEYTSYSTGNIDPHNVVPFTLKCLLFNRYAKTAMGTREETAKYFADFLKKYYET